MSATLMGGVVIAAPTTSAFAQDAPPLDSSGAPENRVFLVSTRVTPEAEDFMHQIDPRVGRVPLISRDHIDPDLDLLPNWSEIQQGLNNECTPDYEGVIVLNWEGEFFQTLKDGPENPNFPTMLERGIELVNFVKGLRPNAKVGIYSIPSGKWHVDYADLAPLYDVLDVLMPNAVIGQADPASYPSMVEKMRKNVEYALGFEGGRPVLAFHSPRHTHADNVRVDVPLWASHMAKTFDYEFEGKRAAGVIIWDQTMRMYFQGELEFVDAPYIPAGMDLWDYVTSIEMLYYCAGSMAVIPDAYCVVESDDLNCDFVDQLTFLPPGDGVVGGADLAFLLSQWGSNPESPADIVSTTTFKPPGDGNVNGADLAVLLSNWTP